VQEERGHETQRCAEYCLEVDASIGHSGGRRDISFWQVSNHVSFTAFVRPKTEREWGFLKKIVAIDSV